MVPEILSYKFPVDVEDRQPMENCFHNLIPAAWEIYKVLHYPTPLNKLTMCLL